MDSSISSRHEKVVWRIMASRDCGTVLYSSLMAMIDSMISECIHASVSEKIVLRTMRGGLIAPCAEQKPVQKSFVSCDRSCSSHPFIYR